MIGPDLQRDLVGLLGERVRFDVATRRFTSLRVGGPADAVAEPADRAELAALLRLCAHHRSPHRVLGRGFNTLVRDEGLDGVLIRLVRFRALEERPGALRVEAGVSHASLTRFCRERGLTGLEFAAGIPGTVGGWIAMNAGIGTREMKDVVRELEVMSPTGAKRRHLPRERLRFVYRGLRGLAPGSVVISALLAVEEAKRAEVEAEVKRLLARRAATQPLDVPSCGSVFKNPPHRFAGQLIEAAGLKGERFGGACISPVHANFIVNEGDATAADVLALIGKARAVVRARTGILLQREVKVWGRGEA
ncbi:MAG: UDP-N-acetylmuramate dehydrogenase [Myxococcota bacterium]|nr:UDP-N-acetylmuramate dehydrogenase [Myxococcota bacterium]